MNIYDYFNKISIDELIHFFEFILGILLSFISVFVSIHLANKQLHQRENFEKKKYYDMLLKSLPSIDSLRTQADYLDDEDGLLGGFSDVESRIDIMKRRIELKNCDDNMKDRYMYKIKKHSEYLTYWNKANRKIEELILAGVFNVIKNECDERVIKAYYDFTVAFSNEHYYAGPVITTSILRMLLIALAVEIKKLDF